MTVPIPQTRSTHIPLAQIDVKMAPKAVSQREEAELAKLMEQLAAEAEEEDGDEEEGDADLA